MQASGGRTRCGGLLVWARCGAGQFGSVPERHSSRGFPVIARIIAVLSRMTDASSIERPVSPQRTTGKRLALRPICPRKCALALRSKPRLRQRKSLVGKHPIAVDHSGGGPGNTMCFFPADRSQQGTCGPGGPLRCIRPTLQPRWQPRNARRFRRSPTGSDRIWPSFRSVCGAAGTALPSPPRSIPCVGA